VEVAGPGFINLRVADPTLAARAAEVAADGLHAGATAVEDDALQGCPEPPRIDSLCLVAE
jgi:hypothetical protein